MACNQGNDPQIFDNHNHWTINIFPKWEVNFDLDPNDKITDHSKFEKVTITNQTCV